MGTSCGDAFLAKLNETGNKLLFSTYYGGMGGDTATALALDNSGNPFLTGYTDSSDLPVKAAFGHHFHRAGCNYEGRKYLCPDAFAPAFDAGGTLRWSTYLGGSRGDYGRDIGLLPDGRVVIVGNTQSNDFPVVQPYQRRFGGGKCSGENPYQTFPCYDAFISVLSPQGNALTWSTYLGGTGSDSANGVAVRGPYLYVTGTTSSTSFPGYPTATKLHFAAPFALRIAAIPAPGGHDGRSTGTGEDNA